jgi:YidC/Oxa1 family membrane protein insertase
VIELIATPVATVLRGIHAVLSQILIPGSGPAWGLSIVLLTVCVRLLLFPLFVKQIKSQRRMQELAPKIKELQARHKGDRETLNAELMKLYKDNNANPISGCLPLVLQLPVFFALFSVINEFRPGKDARFGLTATQLAEGGQAKVFGAPISAAFNSNADLLAKLDGNATTVKIVAATMIVLMGASTFWTQRQMMARGGTVTDPQQQQIQKFMLYVLPFSFAIFGFTFPIGVLLYWLTTNLWSMGQQHWVIKRMPPASMGGTPPKGKPGSGGSGSGGPKAPKGPEPKAPGAAAELPAADPDAGAVLTATAPRAGSPGARRNAGSRKNKKKGRR